MTGIEAMDMIINDFPGLDHRMREQAQEFGGREWRELPDQIRTEHVIAYLRICDFAETLSEALTQAPPSIAHSERWLGWLETFAHGDQRKPSPEATVLVSSLYAHLANYVSDSLAARWDRLRYETGEMDKVERGVYEQEGRRDG